MATTALRPLGRLLRDAVRLDRTQSDPIVAARNAVGIAAPLVIAALSGSVAAGLPSTIGALQTGLADRPGPYRLRAVRMLGTAVAAGTTSALAVLVSRNDALAVLLLLVLAFAAGLLGTAGPSASQVGIAATAAALVIGHLPQSPSAALHVGLLVVAGGAGQTLLALVGWPLGRHKPERQALAGLYRELAEAARRPAGTRSAPPATLTVGAVRQTLYGLGHDHGPSVEAYRVLLDEAERIRRDIPALVALIERLAASGSTVSAGLARSALTACGGVLDAVADALLAGRTVHDAVLVPARAAVRAALARLEQGGDLTARAAAARLTALAGQLRAVVETSETGAREGRRAERSDVRGAPRLRDGLAGVRANLDPRSEALRHAVRTAVLVAGSDLVVRVLGFTHGYWVSLTVLVVLRPDFGSTFQRAVLRVVGTVLGLVLATEVLHWIPSSTGWFVALIALAYFGMRLAGPTNVGLTAVALSALVVALLALDGVAPRETVVARASATVVGGALALVAALLLPNWERERLPVRLADLLAAYREYLDVLIGTGDRLRARSAARLARTNALASLERARAEPVPGRDAIDLGEGVIANSHRVVHALITIDAVGSTLRAAPPELDDLLQACSVALRACEQALRAGVAPRGLPPLRPAQLTVHAVLRAQPDRFGGTEAAGALADATDRLANSIDTLIAELRRRLTAIARDEQSTVAP